MLLRIATDWRNAGCDGSALEELAEVEMRGVVSCWRRTG
jgi:hypothetical protein